MKILHIVPSYKPAYTYGGPIMSISKLCEGLSQLSDVEITLLTTTANGKEELRVDTEKEIQVDGVSVIYFTRTSGDPHHISPSLWRYLYSNANRYDVVHIHSWWNLLSIISALICIIKKKKMIVSPRGMLSQYIFETSNPRQKRYLHKGLGRYLLSRGWFHATADPEYAECKALIPHWKGFTIPNLIDLPPIDIVKPHKKIFTLGFLSRIDPKKGLPFVFEAIASLPFPLVLKIAGEGEDDYLAELKELANRLEITNKIEWIGWKGPETKFIELMNFDLFVLSSFNENFANVVIEALYTGTPVCISRQVGLSSFVEKHQLGWVTDLTSESVRQTISEAYFSVNKRRQIEANARNIVISEFANDVIIQKYVDMYKTIVQAKKGDQTILNS